LARERIALRVADNKRRRTVNFAAIWAAAWRGRNRHGKQSSEALLPIVDLLN
jgi:hypothetical protein